MMVMMMSVAWLDDFNDVYYNHCTNSVRRGVAFFKGLNARTTFTILT